MHKAAGATFHRIFTHVVVHTLHGFERACDEMEWDWKAKRCAAGGALDKDAAQTRPRLLSKGHALSMAASTPWLRPACKWITVAREPVARLVSAFFFCRSSAANRRDPLCGSSHFQYTNSTVLHFAQHWGNFAFRELLLHPRLRGTAATGTAFRPASPVWWAWKRAVGDAENLWTPEGRVAFETTRHVLDDGTLFDTVGLLERFNDTCRLLDRLYPLPPAVATSYATLASRFANSHGSARYAVEEHSARDAARGDPAVRALVATDLQLYWEVLTPLFERQLIRAGLAPGPGSSLIRNVTTALPPSQPALPPPLAPRPAPTEPPAPLMPRMPSPLLTPAQFVDPATGVRCTSYGRACTSSPPLFNGIGPRGKPSNKQCLVSQLRSSYLMVPKTGCESTVTFFDTHGANCYPSRRPNYVYFQPGRSHFHFYRPCSISNIREPCDRIASIWRHIRCMYTRYAHPPWCSRGFSKQCADHWAVNTQSVDQFVLRLRDHWSEVLSFERRDYFSRHITVAHPQSLYIGNQSWVLCTERLSTELPKLAQVICPPAANKTVPRRTHMLEKCYEELTWDNTPLSPAGCNIVRELYSYDDALWQHHCGSGRGLRAQSRPIASPFAI